MKDKYLDGYFSARFRSSWGPHPRLGSTARWTHRDSPRVAPRGHPPVHERLWGEHALYRRRIDVVQQFVRVVTMVTTRFD